MSNVEALFAGLPETGKTTYLALIYQAILDKKAGGIELGRYDDDRRYVNEISGDLLACRPAVHTEVEDRRELRLSLQVDGADLLLRVPDRSGEVWDHALDERRWSADLDEHVRGAQGFLVFVHCTDLETAVTIAAARAAEAALSDDVGPVDEVAADMDAATDGATEALQDAIAAVDDQPDDAEPPDRTRQTQVALVDLIQLLSQRARARPARMSLVVSAWDLAPPKLTPGEWLHKNCPLLEQFLRHNTASIDTRVWGVSAQGGDFENEKKQAALLKRDAVDRASIRSDDGTTCSVHAPLAWALALDA